MAIRRGSVLLDAGVLLAWLASAGLVVVHERGHLGRGAINPMTAIRATLDVNEQWFGIYYEEQKIGFAHTMLVPEEREGMPGIAVADRGELSFTLLGQPQRVALSARAFIDADWRLQEFEARLQTATHRMTWSGRRRGEVLHLTVATDGGSETVQLRDQGNAFVVGLSPWTAFHHLAVGQWGNVWILNPLALRPEPVYFHVRALEMVEGRPALVVESDVRGLHATSWVTPDGEVLRETSPLGWELRRETRELAVGQAVRAPALDLLSMTAVPLDRPLGDPARMARLVLLIEGASPDAFEVRRPSQVPVDAAALAADGIRPPDGPWAAFALHRPAAPQGPAAAPPAALERYRRASPYVQSEDPRIRAKAREIVGGLEAPWAQAVALHQWVHRTLVKRLTVGLPSAVDVLATAAGDCHEHTVLFTALARSVGLPTRMVAGLVAYDRQLYYHAWPEVWIGAWVPLDPTLGQAPADATHLGLVEAESEALTSLAKFVGQLRVRVIRVEEDPPPAGTP
jgi:hypothetical protein